MKPNPSAKHQAGHEPDVGLWLAQGKRGVRTQNRKNYPAATPHDRDMCAKMGFVGWVVAKVGSQPTSSPLCCPPS